MKRILITLLVLSACWLCFADEQPPFEVKDPAATENFRNIYYQTDQLNSVLGDFTRVVGSSSCIDGPTFCIDEVNHVVNMSSFTASGGKITGALGIGGDVQSPAFKLQIFDTQNGTNNVYSRITNNGTGGGVFYNENVPGSLALLIGVDGTGPPGTAYPGISSAKLVYLESVGADNTYLGASSPLFLLTTNNNPVIIRVNNIEKMRLFNSSVTIVDKVYIPATSNQIVLGTVTVTLSAPVPAAARVYTIPDAGADANVILSSGAVMQANMSMGSKKIVSLSSGTVTGDAVNYDQIHILKKPITTTLQTSTSTTVQTYVLTGLSQTITPSATTSGIQIDFSGTLTANAATPTGAYASLTVYRDTTDLCDGTIGCARATALITSTSIDNDFPASFSFVDNPNTISAVTYSIRMRANGALTTVLNRAGGTSKLTLMEVK